MNDLTGDLKGRRWVRRFRGGAIATLRFEGGQMQVEWQNQPHRKQKARLRRIVSEYVSWKHSIMQGIADANGKALLDVTQVGPTEWLPTIIKPRKEGA